MGDLIDKDEAERKEVDYCENEETCNMFYFTFQSKTMVINPTRRLSELCRFVSHAKDANLLPRVLSINGTPRIFIISKCVIDEGCELFFDYGVKDNDCECDWLSFRWKKEKRMFYGQSRCYKCYYII